MILSDNDDSESEDCDGFDDKGGIFFDLQIWEQIGKNLEDFTADDMKKLQFKRHEDCILFYKMYAKVKGFGIRRKCPNHSKVDGKITSQRIWCNREGYRLTRFLEKRNRKRRPKPTTRCGCKALIIFKWDYHTDTWYVSHFEGEHNHPLATMTQVPFIRYPSILIHLYDNVFVSY